MARPSSRPRRRSSAITSRRSHPPQQVTRTRPPSPSRRVRLRPWCSGQRQRQPRPSRRASPSAWAMSAALMELRLQAWPPCSADCGAAAARAAHHLRKSSTAARSGAPSPTAARRPNGKAHAIQTFGRAALRHASPWLRASLPSRGSPPRSGHRPSCDELNGR